MKSVYLFDVYTGDKLAKNKKSYALSFIFEDFNTKGLSGDCRKGSFKRLLIDEGVSEKEHKNSLGGFGIGKNAFFAFTGLQTVFYSSLNSEGRKFMGVTKLAEVTSRIDTMLTTAGLPARGPQGMGGHKGKGGPGKFMSATLATTLKLTQEELKTQLHSGKSLADVAKAQSVDIADVKTVLTSDFTAHLAEEVTSGKHTQAEADAKLAEFKTNLDTMVNRVGPAGGMKGEGRGHGPRGGNGPMGQGTPSAQNTSASI